MKNILYQESIVEIKHLFRMMRNTLLALFVFAGTAFATESYSQTMKVTVVADNMSTGKVISEIEKQTDYLFVYNVNEVNLKRNVKVNAQNKSVAEVLNKVFEGTDIYYAMEGKNIMLMSKAKDGEVAQQANKVTGIVKDTNGEPIIGANVTVKGQSIGTITDIDGRFVLDAPKNAVLQITYIGYVSQEVKVGSQKELNIILKEDTKTLDEVVVIGYGSMRKKDLTGAVVQINPNKVADTHPTNVQELLRGTAGLQIGYDTSAKGGGSIQLRGQNSVYTDGDHNAPLIVLDGMVFYGELSEINPNDISQIDVLKDASSTAIYGAKAACGVIIITTKKGKVGKPVINISTSLGLDTKSDFRSVYDAMGYMKFREDWYKTTTLGFDEKGNYSYYAIGDKGVGYYDSPDNLLQYGMNIDQWKALSTSSDGESLQSIYARRLGLDESSNVYNNYLLGKTVNWEDQVFRTGIRQDYNANISGASDRINYYISFGYLKNQGVLYGDDYKSFRSNLKVNGKVTDWLEIGANINVQDRSDGTQSINLETEQNMLSTTTMLRLSPYASLYDEDGSYIQYPMDSDIKRGYNYWFSNQYNDLEKGYTIFNTVFNSRIKLPFNITYDFNIAPRYQFFYDRYFMSADYPDSNVRDRGVNRGWAKRFDWSLNNTITWDYTFKDVHHFMVTLVQEAEERRYWSDNIKARNIQPSDALGFHNTQNATLEDSSFGTDDTHETACALLGRLFYSYDNRYLFTGSVRRDGYSAFGSSNPYATFPSFSVAWNFSNEKFVNLPWLNTGKLRFSWGKNGNRSLANSYLSLANLGAGLGATMNYLNPDGSVATDMKYLMMDRLANPGLQWEKTESFNIGLDFAVLDNRLSGSIDYYFKKTHDMIMSQRLPNFSGFSSIYTNLGEIQNTGVELSFSSVNIDRPNFRWTSTLNFSFNANKINHLYYEYEDVIDNTGNVIGKKEMDDKTNGWFIGKAIDEIWDFKVEGIWQVDEAEKASLVGQRPGDPKVSNIYTADDIINEDGTRTPVYNDRDKVFQGKKTPPIYWNLRNNFTIWKNLDIYFSLYSYMGHKSKSVNYLNQLNQASSVTYAFNNFKGGYWLPENPTNKYARLDALGPSGATAPAKVYNRSFIRLDNISLGYTLPQKWTRKFLIDRIRVTASIRNIAVFTNDWEYGDPETGGLATRTYNFGLNFTL